jgi:hypothetical protein
VQLSFIPVPANLVLTMFSAFTAGKAVDAFLNFETVKLFGTALLEVRQYDASLVAYQVRDGRQHTACSDAASEGRGAARRCCRGHILSDLACCCDWGAGCMQQSSATGVKHAWQHNTAAVCPCLFGNFTGLPPCAVTLSSSTQRSVVRLDLAAAALNAGQALILAAGMTGAMLAAAATPPASAAAGAAAAAATGITAGDLVMVQGLLVQLWAPLQFLVSCLRPSSAARRRFSPRQPAKVC